MKRRNLLSLLLYLLGAVLVLIANSSVVSGSPIKMEYFQRVILCGAAVTSVAVAPFLFRAKTSAGAIIKFIVPVVLICCIFAFGGFENNRMP